MCGIVGYSGEFDQQSLEAAVNRLSHRGPDDSGVWTDEQRRVGLGHTRLSINDLSADGHQPMHSRHERTAVMSFNGEIYNFNELREGLVGLGYKFRSRSDSEVLLNLYLEYGEDCLRKLNGIFAFAIYDADKNRLFIARDGFGIKPIYIHQSERGVLFASEIKALLDFDCIDRSINYEALNRYLTFLWCPGDETPLTEVRKLKPGHYLVVKDGRVVKDCEWYRVPATSLETKLMTPKTAIIEVQDQLRAAVERQLVADVPVGAFLSGGVDSTAIVALAKEYRDEIQCFTIQTDEGVDPGVTDDLPYAQLAAKELGVDLHTVSISSSQMVSDIESMVYQLDEPLADPAPLNVRYISELAKSHGIKVLLSGAGGDDVYTGYRRHTALYYDSILRLVPNPIKKFASEFFGKRASSSAFARRGSKLLSGVELKGDDRLVNFFEWSGSEDLRHLYSQEMLIESENSQAAQPMHQYLQAFDTLEHQLDRMLTLEQRFFLSDHNLLYTDKMSMAAGVEVRVPFLDPELVQHSWSIPRRYKQKGVTGKWVLREAVSDIVPEQILNRPKTGFGAPVRNWMRGELLEMMRDLLTSQRFRERGIFNHLAVRQLIGDNLTGKIDAAYLLFSLMCIETWCRRFVDQDIPAIGTSV